MQCSAPNTIPNTKYNRIGRLQTAGGHIFNNRAYILLVRFISRVMLQASGGGGGVNPLGLSNVAGVFLVTLAGCGMATIFAVIEFLYGTRKAAMEAGVSWLEEMSTELKFIFTCHGNTKKVG